MNHVGVITNEHESLWYVSLGFFRYISRSGMPGSYGSSILRLLKTIPPESYKSCISLYSYQYYIGVPLLLTTICYLVY